ncbi:DNA methyltransferase [Anabaena azotica]|uniref:DNA methylase N-4/N-6 domain-containing protein n=1 Tax=Anabaena azotica FACHB-119 TaxID=947527 RepID=A0ABR8D0I0_9NOST|nr:DNA methyltransferase [Anabaena azotica]MBD2499822.1 hypothetical protein [Anabaena azotica FACHB-119]
MTNPFQLQLFNPSSDDCPKIVRERTGSFIDNMKLPVHRWFRYSAGFSAAWVEELIKDLEPQIILDPFAGSGTVCIAADKLGVSSYGVKAHPFVYWLAKGKISWNEDIYNFLAVIKLTIVAWYFGGAYQSDRLIHIISPPLATKCERQHCPERSLPLLFN